MPDPAEPVSVSTEAGKILVDFNAQGGTWALTLTMGGALMLAKKLCAAVQDVSRAARDADERNTQAQ
jgi:hypothetical protein